MLRRTEETDERHTQLIKRTYAIAATLLTSIVFLLWPLITQALEKKDETLYLQQTKETVLDADALTWEQIASSPEFVEHLVRASFPDAPVMVEIARAESQFNPTAKNPNSTATGVFQILIGTWEYFGCTGSRTNALDNIACARKIYDRNGTRDWNASAHAWAS